MSDKIHPRHLARKAILYVRQSSSYGRELWRNWSQGDQYPERDLNNADQRRKPAYGHDAVAPGHQRAVGDQPLNAFGLVGGKLQRPNPEQNGDEPVAYDFLADAFERDSPIVAFDPIHCGCHIVPLSSLRAHLPSVWPLKFGPA